MTDYTKVNIRKELMKKIKIRAAAENRSIANYIDTVLMNNLALTVDEFMQDSIDHSYQELMSDSLLGVKKKLNP